MISFGDGLKSIECRWSTLTRDLPLPMMWEKDKSSSFQKISWEHATD